MNIWTSEELTGSHRSSRWTGSSTARNRTGRTTSCDAYVTMSPKGAGLADTEYRTIPRER